jgi:hypothetical protein
MKTKTSVSILNPQDEILMAMALIDKFKIKNKIEFNLEIVEDFNIEEMGVCFPFNQPRKSNHHQYVIYINPSNCEKLKDDSDFCTGYVKDLSIFGVTIHEFAHIMSFNIYKGMVQDYKKEFPINRLYLNDYSNHHIDDEIAELIVLEMTNPYLLKLISEPHHIFFNKYFKSPVICTRTRCKLIYDIFPITCKENLKTKLGIVFNETKNDFDRIGIIKNVKAN